MRQGIKSLRATITARWQTELRELARDQARAGAATSPDQFVDAFYDLFSALVVPIRGALSPGGMAHADDRRLPGHPGVRISQTRLRLVSVGPAVNVNAYRCTGEDASVPDPSLGLDRLIDPSRESATDILNRKYELLVDFIERALRIDLNLRDGRWLYHQLAADNFRRTGTWISVKDAHRLAVAEYGSRQTFEEALVGLYGRQFAGMHTTLVRLSVRDLHEARDTDAEVAAFISVLRFAVSR